MPLYAAVAEREQTGIEHFVIPQLYRIQPKKQRAYKMTWAAVVKFFTDNPIARWIAAAIVVLLGWETVKRHLKEAGRKAERQASAVKQAQIKEAVTTRSAEIIREERDNADAALTARNSGNSFPTSDSVPDPIAAVLFRGEGSDKAG